MKLIHTLLIALALLNGLFIYNYFRQKKMIEDHSKRANDRITAIESAWNESLIYSGNLYCNTDLNLISVDNKQTSLKTLISEKKDILILRIAQSFCTKCLHTELPKLLQFSKVIGRKNVLLITNISNLTEIYQMLQMKNILLDVYGINDRENIFKNANDQSLFAFPYLFTLDSSAVAKSFYVTNTSDQALSGSYYASLKERMQQEIHSSDTTSYGKKPVISFSETTYDFGKMIHNKPTSHDFSLQNNSDLPLYILSVDAGCECTTVNYPLNEIKPHAMATITINYDAQYKGAFKRKILIFSNAANSPASLYIEGTVE